MTHFAVQLVQYTARAHVSLAFYMLAAALRLQSHLFVLGLTKRAIRKKKHTLDLVRVIYSFAAHKTLSTLRSLSACVIPPPFHNATLLIYIISHRRWCSPCNIIAAMTFITMTILCRPGARRSRGNEATTVACKAWANSSRRYP